MLKTLIFSLTFCIASLLSAPQQTFASSSVGRIAQAYGPAWILNGNKRIKAEKGMILFRNDNIITGTRARVKVIMGDGSKLYVGTKSRISLKEYSLAGKSLVSATIHMLWGKARFFVNKLVSRNSSFRVHTPTAVLGVRGTEFIVSVSPLDEMLNNPFSPRTLASMPPLPTRTVLIEGSVNVSTNTGHSVLLMPGNTADVDAKKQIQTHKTKSTDMDKHNPPSTKPQHNSNEKGGAETQSNAPTPPSLLPQTQGEGLNNKEQAKKSPAFVDTKPIINAIQNLGSTTNITIQTDFVKP